MQTPYICSYIVPYYHTTENFKKLEYTIKTLSQDPRVQIILVETGNISKLDTMDIKVSYYFVESNTWNVGWLFNYGASKTSTSKLFFSSFQYVPRLDVIHSIIQNHQDRHCIYLQDSVIHLTKEQTESRQFDINLPKESIPYEGVYYYSKEGYFACGGYDENVFDRDLYNIQDHRNKSLITTGLVNGVTIFKLHVDLPKVPDELVEYSKQHSEKILKLDQNMMRNYIISQVKKKGSYSKYQNNDISTLII